MTGYRPLRMCLLKSAPDFSYNLLYLRKQKLLCVGRRVILSIVLSCCNVLQLELVLFFHHVYAYTRLHCVFLKTENLYFIKIIKMQSTFCRLLSI